MEKGSLIPALWLGLAGCTPDALDLELDLTAHRHWAEGDVYEIRPDACEGPVTEPLPTYEGQQFGGVTILNEYFETTIEVVLVEPDCTERSRGLIEPRAESSLLEPVPYVFRVLDAEDGETISAWTLFNTIGGVVHVQP